MDDEAEIFRTCSCHGRGIDLLNGAHRFLDLDRKSRDRGGLEFSMEWARWSGYAGTIGIDCQPL
jgi:predicted dithiol-disulfide oxidoreductase (DUF899 family)